MKRLDEAEGLYSGFQKEEHVIVVQCFWGNEAP